MTHRIKTTDKQGNIEYHLITVPSADSATLARAIARIAHAGTHGVGFSTIRAEDWLLSGKTSERKGWAS